MNKIFYYNLCLLYLFCFSYPLYSQEIKSIKGIELTLDQNQIKLEELIEDRKQAQTIIIFMLTSQNYEVLDYHINLLIKHRCILGTVSTKQGKKFIKLVEKQAGLDEFQAAASLQEFIPIIPAEALITTPYLSLIVQPYIEDINVDQGMLTDVIASIEYECNPKKIEAYYSLFKKIYTNIFDLTSKTASYDIKEAKNDRFFFDRLKTKEKDGQLGRLEDFYTGKRIQLGNQQLEWKELIKKKWVIDGIIYKESLEELITEARDFLDPQKPRVIATCHGDGHEMNIFTDILNPEVTIPRFAYIDLETGGDNSVLGDAVIYLVYNSIMADYLVPKYYPDYFADRHLAMKAFEDHFFRKEIKPIISFKEEIIELQRVYQFGTSPERKKIANLYCKIYLYPMIDLLKSKFRLSTDIIENTLKSSFLLRFLGVYNLTIMEPLDQIKMIGILYKVIGTPINVENNKFSLERFQYAT